MPYIQPNTNNIFGLNPVEGYPGHGQTRLYAVSSSEGTAILPGDGIQWSTVGGTVKAVGAIASTQVTGFIGAAAQSLSTASFAQGTLNLLVYDDPNQHYVITNTTSGNMALASIGKTVALCTTSTGTGIPSTSLSRSKHAIGAVSASSGQQLLVVAIHPVETFTSALSGTFKWIVRPSGITANVYGNVTS